MNESFENKLRRQPLRPLPAEWRAEILRAVRQPAASPAPEEATWIDLWSVWCRRWLWPSPTAWLALAGVWLVMAGLQLAASWPIWVAAKEETPVRPNEILVWVEQHRLMSQLLDSWPAPTVLPNKPAQPRPRSERKSTEPGWVSA